MSNDEDNVILFPKWKNTLREEGFLALQEKRYIEALDKLNELLQYNTEDHEIIIGKLMCLMELGRYQEAEDMCEEIIQNKQVEHHYQYIHIYLTILFQTNKYNVLMDIIENELASENLPDVLREQFLQLYDMSEKMEMDVVEKKSSIYTEELLEAVSASNHDKQWRAIVQLRSMGVDPDSNTIDLLVEEDIHPVIKTAIFCWLQESHYTRLVNVGKFGKKFTIKPHDIPEIPLTEAYKRILGHLHEVEQGNPTLYHFLEKLLYRYFYVHYPILPLGEDSELVAESLKIIGYQIMNQQEISPIEKHEKAIQYMEDILNCEQLYLSIIED